MRHAIVLLIVQVKTPPSSYCEGVLYFWGLSFNYEWICGVDVWSSKEKQKLLHADNPEVGSRKREMSSRRLVTVVENNRAFEMLHVQVSRPLDYQRIETSLQLFCINFAKLVVLYYMCIIFHWIVNIFEQLTCIIKKFKIFNFYHQLSTFFTMQLWMII